MVPILWVYYWNPNIFEDHFQTINSRSSNPHEQKISPGFWPANILDLWPDYTGFDKKHSYGLFSIYHRLAVKKLTTTSWISSKRRWFQILWRVVPRKMRSIDPAIRRNSAPVFCSNTKRTICFVLSLIFSFSPTAVIYTPWSWHKNKSNLLLSLLVSPMLSDTL